MLQCPTSAAYEWADATAKANTHDHANARVMRTPCFQLTVHAPMWLVVIRQRCKADLITRF